MSEATKTIRPPGTTPGATPRLPAARARAVLILGYAAAVYGLFLVVLVYAVGFFAGFGVPAYAVLVTVQFAGWAVALGSTFMISHFDLFGLRQARLHLRGTGYTPPAFTQRGLYRRIRHPLMTGFLIVFWAAPVMTAGHLLFAAAATGYILAGIWFEERDLVRSLGPAYASYLTRVPALVPGLRRRRS
jgi:methanethiol S-methyltransferase